MMDFKRMAAGYYAVLRDGEHIAGICRQGSAWTLVENKFRARSWSAPTYYHAKKLAWHVFEPQTVQS